MKKGKEIWSKPSFGSHTPTVQGLVLLQLMGTKLQSPTEQKRELHREDWRGHLSVKMHPLEESQETSKQLSGGVQFLLCVTHIPLFTSQTLVVHLLSVSAQVLFVITHPMHCVPLVTSCGILQGSVGIQVSGQMHFTPQEHLPGQYPQRLLIVLVLLHTLLTSELSTVGRRVKF